MSLNQNIWTKLEDGLPSGERIAARLAIPNKSRKLYAGLDSYKQRHLLIPLEENEEEYYDSESRGISVKTKELIIKGSEQKKYIDIICQDVSGHVIFDAIAEDIAEKLDKGISREIIINVIGKWRNFWDKSVQDLLSYNVMTGLFAELWFLYYWLFPRMDKLSALAAWRGPFSSRHDFEWIGKSVEVKATTNVHSRTHKINGIEQLSPPENGELFLFSLRIREEHGANNDLPKLISLCREKLKDNSKAITKFENILGIIGYSPIHDNEYSKIKFRVVDERLYRVTDEFPRLIEDSFVNGIPPGIGTIEYNINLDGYDNLCLAKSHEEKIDF